MKLRWRDKFQKVEQQIEEATNNLDKAEAMTFRVKPRLTVRRVGS